jgi:hypothetical protein
MHCPSRRGRTEGMKLRHNITTGVGLVALSGSLFALGVVVSPTAEAAGTQCVSGGCDLFQFGPDNGYFFTTPGGAAVGMVCWTDAQWYDGTNRWFKIKDIFGTGTNWTSANEVKNQIRVGHC